MYVISVVTRLRQRPFPTLHTVAALFFTIINHAIRRRIMARLRTVPSSRPVPRSLFKKKRRRNQLQVKRKESLLRQIGGER